MLYKSKNRSKSLFILFAVILGAALLFAVFFCSLTAPNDAAFAASTDMIYWGVTAENKLIISSNESDVASAVSGKSGSFKSNYPILMMNSVPWFNYRETITEVQVAGSVAPTSTKYWFYSFTRAAKIDLSGLDTSNVTDASATGLLSQCSALQTLILPTVIPSTVTMNLPGQFSVGQEDFTSVSAEHQGQTIYRHEPHNFQNGVCTVCGEYALIYWGVTADQKKLIISSKESDVPSDASGKGSFAGNEVYTRTSPAPWNSSAGNNTVTEVEVADSVYPTSTAYWFFRFSNATTFSLTGLKTTNLTKMTSMFESCSEIESLAFPQDFNTENVSEFGRMFFGCNSLKTLNLTPFTIKESSNTGSMLSGCGSLETIYLPIVISSGININLFAKFWSGSLPLITTATSADSGKTLKRHDAHNFQNGVCTVCGEYELIYWGVTADQKKLIISSNESDVPSDASGKGSFASNAVFTHTSRAPWDGYSGTVTNVEIMGNVSPLSTAYWFYNFQVLAKIDNLTNLKTDRATDMSCMFRGCEVLTQETVNKELDVSHFDTSNVTDMSEMFEGCMALNHIKFSENFVTNNVTNMNGMFILCNSLEEVDMSSFDISNISDVTDIAEIFVECIPPTIYAPKIIGEVGLPLPTTYWSGKEIVGSVTKTTQFATADRKLVVHAAHNLDEHPAKAATCTEDGTSAAYWHCSICGKNYSDAQGSNEIADITTLVVPKLGHAYGNWTVTKEATCTEAGSRYRVCTRDGHRETEVIPMIAHTVVQDAAVSPNCTTAGKTAGSHCSVCSTVIVAQTTVAALGHAYASELTVDSQPTCTDVGSKSKHCSRCDAKSEVTVIAALGHAFSTDFTVDSEPTCTDAGSKSKHCSRCDAKTDVTEIAALGHAYGEWTVTKEATCSEAGSRYCVCTRDGHRETEVIPMIAHTVVQDAAVAPTCTTAGKTAGSHCSVCSTVIVAQTTVAALGHDYASEFTVDSQPTCTENGSKSKHCSRCDAKTDVTQINALGHDYGEWSVTKEPTIDEFGEETRACSRNPAHVETRQIAKLPADKPKLEWYRILIIVVLSLIIVGEVSYLVYRKFRKNRAGKEGE